MFQALGSFFDSAPFMPHGHCYLWRPELLWLHVISDVLIASAYFLIPIALIQIVRKRADLAFSGIFLLFASFIVACGITHLFGIWTIWNPDYAAEGVAKALTGLVSIGTALMLWIMIPEIVKLPGVAQFKTICQKLEDEIDIRKEAQDALERRANQMRLIINQLPVAVCYIDAGLRLRYCNATYAQWEKKQKSQIIGSHMKDIQTEQALQKTASSIVRALAGETVKIDEAIRFHDKERHVSVQDLPDMNAQGEVVGVIRLITDISYYVEVENALKKSKEAAEASNIAKSAFVANISHEIRTPLGAVVGFAEMVTRNNISASDRQKYVTAIKRNSDLVVNIVDDILDISKMEAGKIALYEKEVDLHDVVADISSIMQQKALSKGLGFCVLTEDPLPQFIITDQNRLNQILINLISNAFKFSEHGTVELKIKSMPESQKPRQLGFLVSDQGIGISDAYKGKLFEPFFQVDATETRSHGGTGLGLTLSKRFANLLGGDIKLLTSELEKGSTFLVTINPSDSRGQYGEQKVKAGRAASNKGMTLPNSGDLSGLKVLLAEDAMDNQFLISTYLQTAGADVKITSNGREALDEVDRNNFDIVLMDLQMPVMGGFEALDQLRKRGKALPILALTAHTMQADKERCAQAGFNDHIAKPIDYNDLIFKVSLHTHDRPNRTETDSQLH